VSSLRGGCWQGRMPERCGTAAVPSEGESARSPAISRLRPLWWPCEMMVFMSAKPSG